MELSKIFMIIAIQVRMKADCESRHNSKFTIDVKFICKNAYNLREELLLLVRPCVFSSQDKSCLLHSSFLQRSG